MEQLQAVKLKQLWGSPGSINQILSNLNLADMEALSKANPHFDKIIRSFLETGHQLNIDKKTVAKYPPEYNSQIYAKYGKLTKNVCISRVQIFDIIPHFKNLKKLSLSTCQITREDLRSLPRSLVELNLDTLLIPQDCLDDWFALLRNSLKKLSLQMICRDNDCTNFDIVLKRDFPNLESLTLIDTNLKVKGDAKISPILERLVLDTSGKILWTDYKKLPITSLELKQCWKDDEYENIKCLKHLEHLKIRRSVDLKQKQDIDAMKLQSLDVHCFEVPKEKNLISKLNEDCIRYLHTFLSLEDCVTLAECVPQFNEIIPHKKLSYLLDKSSLKKRPVKTNTGFYERLGRWVTSLEVGKISEKEFRKVTGYFIKLETVQLAALPTKTEIIRGWNGTVKNVFIADQYPQKPTMEDLAELHGIEEFQCVGLVVTPKILQFLSQNKLSMKRLGATFVEGLVNDFCVVVGQMRKLKALRLVNVSRKILAKGSFPELEDLDLNVPEEDNNLLLTVEHLKAPKIRTLVLQNRPLMFGRAIKDRMPGLKELTLTGDFDPDMDLLSVIIELKIISYASVPLTKLRLEDDFSVDDTSLVLHILEIFPQLTVLDTNSGENDASMIFAVMSKLSLWKRSLLFNSMAIDGDKPMEYPFAF